MYYINIFTYTNKVVISLYDLLRDYCNDVLFELIYIFWTKIIAIARVPFFKYDFFGYKIFTQCSISYYGIKVDEGAHEIEDRIIPAQLL